MRQETLSLEDLLGQRQIKKDKVDLEASQMDYSIGDIHPEDKHILTASGNASLFDLMQMIEKLVALTLKDLKVEFIPDEGKIPITKADEKIDNPIITYRLIERTPKGELKPRVRQQINEKTVDEKEGRIGQVFGQKFTNYVQFDIYASVYGTAEQVMERFEELLFVYAGHFKNKGIGEILFKKQITDKSLDMFRQSISIRSVQYYIETEKITTLFREKIQEIEILGS